MCKTLGKLRINEAAVLPLLFKASCWYSKDTVNHFITAGSTDSTLWTGDQTVHAVSHSSLLNTLLRKREIRATIYWTLQTEMELQFTGKTGFVQFSWAWKFIFGITTITLQHSLMCNNVFKSSSEIFLRAPWRTLQSYLFGYWPPLISHCITFLSRHPELHLAVWDHCHEKSISRQSEDFQMAPHDGSNS